jgi:Rps23 Pro-64 3,4-dihydroxylase Tpa1-like proline 4-hydroxylase
MLISQRIIFNENECATILSIIKKNEINWFAADRKYNSYDLNLNPKTEWIFDRLKIFVENEIDLKIRKIKELIHFHKYTIGDYFNIHNDDRDNRLYSVGVLLNDTFVGGDFKLYNTDEVVLNKIIGNAYIFDVRIKHEITQIVNGERYSLLWFLQNEHIKSNIKVLI